MFTRRICSLFACSAVALLLLIFCTGDSALSGNGQALPILMYHSVHNMAESEAAAWPFPY